MSTQAPVPPDGRTRRRFEAMRRVQAAALDLFEARGFEQVTVEQVAAAAGVGTATVFRNFSTKEQLVLWDEYDPLLLEAIAAALEAGEPPLAAVREGVVQALGQVYTRDSSRILRRARLILASPALRLRTGADLVALRKGLEEVLSRRVRQPLPRAVLAAAATGALEVAIDAWVAAAGKTPLRTVVKRAFQVLETAGSPGGAR